MTPINNRASVDKFLESFRHRDAATQFALMHPGIVIHEPEGLPYGGFYHGHAGWRALNKLIMATWDNLQLEVEYVLGEADGDRFAVKGKLTGVSKNTGQLFEAEVFEMWRLVDGVIVELRPFYWDTRRVAEINGDIRIAKSR
ncbi:MAG: nuclear transport factor 2 family protein [Spongiibacteraceae bacterium]